MTTVLGIDTSTALASVATTKDSVPVRESSAPPEPDGRPRHSAALLAEIERCLEAAGGWGEIDRIAVGLGPGSYTGLRIGISTARALAQARGLPIAGVSSLKALARGIAAHPGAGERPLLPLVDARRAQLFAALYEPTGEERWPALVAEPGEIARRCAVLEPAPLAAGDGALRFRSELETVGVAVAPAGDAVHEVAARHVCALAEAAEPSAPEAIEPIYLRAPDAQIWLERDRRQHHPQA